MEQTSREYSVATRMNHSIKTKPAMAFEPIAGYSKIIIGGETGIRTLGGVAPSLVFETSPFDHSGISPRGRINGC